VVYKDLTHFYPLRKDRYVRFDFGESTVLSAWRGLQVSFNTTEGGGEWRQFINRPATGRSTNKGGI
jgi:hypothetical protein